MSRTALSLREQEALWLFGWYGLSAKQVGDKMGLSLETVKSYIKRSRESMRGRGVACATRADLVRAALTECVYVVEAKQVRWDLMQRLSEERFTWP